jgi:hypothetical protein
MTISRPADPRNIDLPASEFQTPPVHSNLSPPSSLVIADATRNFLRDPESDGNQTHGSSLLRAKAKVGKHNEFTRSIAASSGRSKAEIDSRRCTLAHIDGHIHIEIFARSNPVLDRHSEVHVGRGGRYPSFHHAQSVRVLDVLVPQRAGGLQPHRHSRSVTGRAPRIKTSLPQDILSRKRGSHPHISDYRQLSVYYTRSNRSQSRGPIARGFGRIFDQGYGASGMCGVDCRRSTFGDEIQFARDLTASTMIARRRSPGSGIADEYTGVIRKKRRGATLPSLRDTRSQCS